MYYTYFLYLTYYLYLAGIIAPEIIMKNYKRQFRELSDETKNKIANSNRNKPKSAEHKMHISQAMEQYWQTVPNKPKDNKIV